IRSGRRLRLTPLVPSGVTPGVPHDVECIAFRASLRVIDLHDSYAAIPRISNQILAATSIGALATGVRGVWRHDSRALETAPLRLSAVHVAQCCTVAADFDLRGAIDHHLDCAFSPAGTAATGDHSLPCEALRAYRGREGATD